MIYTRCSAVRYGSDATSAKRNVKTNQIIIEEQEYVKGENGDDYSPRLYNDCPTISLISGIDEVPGNPDTIRASEWHR